MESTCAIITDFLCHVITGNELSDGLMAGQGLHKGDPWSMQIIFPRYYDDKLGEPRNDSKGESIGNIYLYWQPYIC